MGILQLSAEALNGKMGDIILHTETQAGVDMLAVCIGGTTCRNQNAGTNEAFKPDHGITRRNIPTIYPNLTQGFGTERSGLLVGSTSFSRHVLPFGPQRGLRQTLQYIHDRLVMDDFIPYFNIYTTPFLSRE